MQKNAPLLLFSGFGIGLPYKVFNIAFKGWKDTPETVLAALLKAASIEVSRNYWVFIGPRIASIMVAEYYRTGYLFS